MNESEKNEAEDICNADKTADEQDIMDTQEVKLSDDLNKTEILENQIKDLKKENAELKDQVLRRAADFDNYRKRMMKEKQELAEYAVSDLLSDMLESLDNFDRTVEAAAKTSDAASIAEGIKMINTSLVNMLESKYGFVSFAEAGEAFNPEEHEAIGSVNGDVKEPEIKEVYLKGYKLKEKIIRHAKVMVIMPEEK